MEFCSEGKLAIVGHGWKSDPSPGNCLPGWASGAQDMPTQDASIFPGHVGLNGFSMPGLDVWALDGAARSTGVFNSA